MNERQVWELIPQSDAGARHPKEFLSLIDAIRHLFDETLPDQCGDDDAERRAFDLECSQEVALHGGPALRESM
jgi:hypothetical protein